MAVAQNQKYFFLLFNHGMFFALGCLIWLCFQRRVRPSWLIGAGICTVGGLAEIYLHSRLFVRDAEQRALGVLEGARCHPILPMTIWMLAVLAIIFSVSFNGRVSELVGPGGAKVTRYLGLMTYPLYLIHQRAGFEIIGRLKPRVGFSTSVFLTGGLMILLSFIIVRFLEKPLQDVFKSVLGVSNEQNSISVGTDSAIATQAVRRVSEFRGQEFRE
jgi:peptidoglycan/LPS O-acetylase OafA/YrhL